MGGPIKLGGIELRPAPFVSGSYEYDRSGSYVIGGKLNITLDGTIVGQDILAQINSITALQMNTDCMTLVIGCDGDSDFIDGSGKIVNLSINRSDNAPFTASYSITIALETINGVPAVEPDEEFLAQYGLSGYKYLKQFSETITVDGDGTVIGYVDNELSVSKSFIKATGQISVASSTTAVCGDTSFEGIEQSIEIIKSRFSQLSQFNFTDSAHLLSSYNGWSKWLDNKSITIDEDGTVSCSFEMYMTNGACTPIARIDLTTDDRISDHQKTTIGNRSINGTINGLSTKTTALLDHKARASERLANAMSAWTTLQTVIANGYWPGGSVLLDGTEGTCEEPDCPPTPANMCYQRLSSNITKSSVAGEISFNAEFGPIDSCASNNYSIETTIEEEYPVVRYREFIVPNSAASIIQYLGDTPHKAVITVRGSLKNCDKTKLEDLKQCVLASYNKAIGPYTGWIRTSYNTNQGTYSYTITAGFIECNG
jgi:hypothetical protein